MRVLEHLELITGFVVSFIMGLLGNQIPRVDKLTRSTCQQGGRESPAESKKLIFKIFQKLWKEKDLKGK